MLYNKQFRTFAEEFADMSYIKHVCILIGFAGKKIYGARWSG